MKTFREIRNIISESSLGDKLWKSTRGSGDFPKLGMINYDPTKKFHTVGKPVVVHAMVDGYHEDYVFYSDGKYVLAVAGHKQVADARGSSDNAMMYMLDAGGSMNPAELKTFAREKTREFVDRILKTTDKVRDFSKEDEGADTAPKSIKRVPFKESVDIKEGKLADEMIRRHFPNVWAMSAKEPRVLDMFHKSVDTANFNAKKKAYGKMKIGAFIRDELNGGYLDPKIIKKLNLKASNDLSNLRGKLNGLKEANFEFVDLDKDSTDTIKKLAKKYGLKVKEKKTRTGTNIDLEGPNAKMGNFMQNLPADALESVNEDYELRTITRKHKIELQRAQRTGNLELSRKAEEDLVNWAMNNGDIRGDDPDEFIEWLDDNLDQLVKGTGRL